MSYASVTSHNAPPPSRQPHPDPALLNTRRGDTTLPDVDSKVTVVPPNFKQDPQTETSNYVPPPDVVEEKKPHGSSKKRNGEDKIKRRVADVEREGAHVWEVIRTRLFQPAVAGGILSIVNVGFLSGVAYAFYLHPNYRSDYRFIATATAGAITLFGGEGYLAEAYLNTEAGRKEQQKAKEEGALLYRRSREVILRPGVLGGLAGVVNLAVLGGVGYASYKHWNMPSWDRRIVSAISIGLLALFTGEGYIAESTDYGRH